MNNCISCGIELIGRKKGFCSDKCRMRNKRAKVEQSELERVLTPEMLASLPVGVVHPTSQPDEHTVGLSAYELKEAVDREWAWPLTTVYAETVYRLLTMSVEELKESGAFIPC